MINLTKHISWHYSYFSVAIIYRNMFSLCNKTILLYELSHSNSLKVTPLNASVHSRKPVPLLPPAGQTLYGRVLWNPEQNLNAAYKLQLEKVYLCTGRDGYVPFFDPTGTLYNEGPQYGCIQPNKHLKHRFLLLVQIYLSSLICLLFMYVLLLWPVAILWADVFKDN